MTIAFVNYADTPAGNDGSAGSVASNAINTTANRLLVAFVKHEGAVTTCGIADTAGNTWVPKTVRSHTNGDFHIYPFYSFTTAADASNVITATFGAARTYRGIAVAQYSKTGSGWQFDAEASDEAVSSDTSLLTSALSVIGANGVVVAGFSSYFASRTFTPDANYTERYDSGTYRPGIADRIVTSGGSYTAGATASGPDGHLLVALAFTETSGLTSLFSAIDETSSDRADYIKATAVDAVCVMDGAPALEEPPAGTNLLIEYDTKLQGDSALQVELLEGSTVIKTASLPNGLGSFAVTPAEWGAVASWPWTPRIRVTSKPGTPPPAEAPEYVASALTVQKEGEGTTNFSATLASDATAGRTLLSFVGVRTAIFAGPVTGNNGNSHTLQDSQAFPSPWTHYSARSYRSYNVSGGSAHSVSGSKSSDATEELTIALLALDGGSIVDSATSTVAANGAGATHTSPMVTTTGPALLVCVASGTGDVNATAPTQTWPGNWTVRQSVAYSSAQAPDGHVPLYLATREVASAGDYSVDVQVTINEGLLFMIYAVSFDAFDDFSQTSGSTQSLANYSSRWAVLEGGFEVRSGVGRVEGTTASYNTARWTAGTFNADQYSIATVEYAAGVIFCGPAVRCQSGANTSYHCETDGEGTVYVSKCLAGSQSTLATRSQNFDSGDRLKLEVSGVGATVTLRVYRATAAAPNSFTQLGADITDSSSPITTAGSPGIFAYTNSSLAGISAWEGGNL